MIEPIGLFLLSILLLYLFLPYLFVGMLPQRPSSRRVLSRKMLGRTGGSPKLPMDRIVKGKGEGIAKGTEDQETHDGDASPTTPSNWESRKIGR